MTQFYLGLVGYSGSGKTTLLEGLIAHFTQIEYSCATIKHGHAHAGFDRPGKDSARHAKAGANQVILAGEGEFALFAKHDLEGEALLYKMMEKIEAVDILLIEGFKFSTMPKIEIYNSDLNRPLLALQDPNVKAVIGTSLPHKHLPCPWFERNKITQIANFILAMKASQEAKSAFQPSLSAQIT